MYFDMIGRYVNRNGWRSISIDMNKSSGRSKTEMLTMSYFDSVIQGVLFNS
jgi:hypothetical protein